MFQHAETARRWSSQYPPPRPNSIFQLGLILALGLLSLLGLSSHIKISNIPTTGSAKHTNKKKNDLQPIKLLDNFCVAIDKAATAGWSNLSDTDCMNQFRYIQKSAIHAIKSNSSTALLLFKHVHKAGGTTLCQVASKNMIVEDVPLPIRSDWTTNCVPFESFLGPHPAVGGSTGSNTLLTTSISTTSMPHSRHLLGTWLGGACFLGFLTPAQYSVLPRHYRPLTFVASEGAFPNVMTLDTPLAMVTMLRNPLDRVLSSYRWWQFMITAMPHSPTECRAYWAPSNATFQEWLTWYPDNWMTRELAGNEALYRKDIHGKPGPLTATDVFKAKQRLHYFAAILIMERPQESEILLKSTFGWKDTDLDGHRAGSVRNSSAEKELARDQPEIFQDLERKNMFDIEIYKYALELHKIQVLDASG